MNIRFETLNELKSNEQIVNNIFDAAQESAKQEIKGKLQSIAHLIEKNETIVVSIDYDTAKVSFSVEGASPERLPIIKNAINSIG